MCVCVCVCNSSCSASYTQIFDENILALRKACSLERKNFAQSAEIVIIFGTLKDH